jgi:Glycosyl transferases group 1
MNATISGFGVEHSRKGPCVPAEGHVPAFPSHAEGLAMLVLEAFAGGVLVVCTPAGGLSEVVVARANLFLILRKTPDHLQAPSSGCSGRAVPTGLGARRWHMAAMSLHRAGRMTAEWQLASHIRSRRANCRGFPPFPPRRVTCGIVCMCRFDGPASGLVILQHRR